MGRRECVCKRRALVVPVCVLCRVVQCVGSWMKDAFERMVRACGLMHSRLVETCSRSSGGSPSSTLSHGSPCRLWLLQVLHDLHPVTLPVLCEQCVLRPHRQAQRQAHACGSACQAGGPGRRDPMPRQHHGTQHSCQAEGGHFVKYYYYYYFTSINP